MHHTDEFLMAQTVVPVHVEEFEHGVQHVFRQVVAGGDPHCSLELGCSQRGKRSCTVYGGKKRQSVLTRKEVLPIPTGRFASVTMLIEKAKSSRLLVNRQKALNSSNVML